MLQKEQEMGQELVARQKQVQSELDYYKSMSASLAQKFRETEEGYYTITKTEFNPHPDVF